MAFSARTRWARVVLVVLRFEMPAGRAERMWGAAVEGLGEEERGVFTEGTGMEGEAARRAARECGAASGGC